jgi:hypothetical protein
LRLTKVGFGYAEFEVTSETQKIIVNEGQTVDIDLNSDGKDDVALKVLSILYNKVQITLKSLTGTPGVPIKILPPAKGVKHELEVVEEAPQQPAAPAPEAAPPAEQPAAPAPTPAPEAAPAQPVQKIDSNWIIFGVLAAVVVIVLIVMFVHSRKKQ